ncbi:Transglutaminase OS=Rhodanobacter lindaniclasticus OX=75310 GN=B1991_02110 PE=4 SV=1 [Rhodanobacter lindaniclasticus]
MLGIRWWQRRHHPAGVPQAIKLPLLLLLTLAIIAYYGNLFGARTGHRTGDRAAGAQTAGNRNPARRARRARFARFTLMTALLFDQGMVSTLVVALGLVPALATLRALEPAQPTTGMARSLLSPLALLAAALPLALLAFVLVPRLSSPLWGAPSRDQARTGLSDRMSRAPSPNC